MAGLIREEDIALVRERADLAEIVGQYVTLRSAGGGALKGLCPFHDEKSPSFHVRPGKGFHCLAAETRVITWEGVRPISELAGGTHRILGRDARWHWAPFRSYGTQQLWKITLTRNRQVKEIFATDGHRWFVQSGRDRSSEREEVTTSLKAGDRLRSIFPVSRISQTTLSPFGVAHGFTFGDGTRAKRGSMALLCPPKDDVMLKWFPNSVTSASGPNLLVHHLPGSSRARLRWRSLRRTSSAGWRATSPPTAVSPPTAPSCSTRRARSTSSSSARSAPVWVSPRYGITTQMREGFPGREPSALHRVHFVNDDLPEELLPHPGAPRALPDR